MLHSHTSLWSGLMHGKLHSGNRGRVNSLLLIMATSGQQRKSKSRDTAILFSDKSERNYCYELHP